MKTVLFFRNFHKFQGGHLKVWHYFNHVLSSPEHTARIEFSPESNWNLENPWRNAREYVVDSPGSVRPDVFFVGGRDWEMLDRHPEANVNIPVLNLVQHMRHTNKESTRFEFLSRKAIRICVSEEVAQAVRETGLARGPILVIPDGLDLENLPAPSSANYDVDVLILAMKRPKLGEKLKSRLEKPGRRVELQSQPLPRSEFLDRIRRARTTLFLPNRTEGFYLPALEGMALGTLVVCPDCIGNRSFCLPGYNAFRPFYKIGDLVQAVEAVLTLPADRAQQFRTNARQTAEAHSLPREREAFLDVLRCVDRLWSE